LKRFKEVLLIWLDFVLKNPTVYMKLESLFLIQFYDCTWLPTHLPPSIIFDPRYLLVGIINKNYRRWWHSKPGKLLAYYRDLR
jgi:hypothetical protein